MSICQESTRPTTAESGVTLAVHDEVSKFGAAQIRREDGIMTSLNVLPKSGEGESPLPEDKKEKALERIEDDWEHDPINPRNWPTRRKYVAMVLVSFYTFIPPLASSMMAPGLPQIALHYDIQSQAVLALTLSVFLLFFGIAPLVIAPLSEMYGRTWIYHIGNIFTLLFSIGCAFAPTTGSFIGFRLLTGVSGAAPIAIGGGSVSDLFSTEQRASAMSMYTLGPLLGPVVGPIIGGFVTETIGIRWVFILNAVLCGIGAVVGIPFLRETYGPVIRRRRDLASGDPEKAAAANSYLTRAHESKLNFLLLNLSRPAILLTRSFICFILSLYMSLLYSYYYLMFSTFSALFSSVYGFSTGTSGLAYLGLGLGFMAATLFGATVSDKLYAHMVAKNNGVGKPEMRIPVLIFASLFVPIGLFWYGWSAQARLHWIMPIIGTGIFGFGMMTAFLPIQLYLVDSFTYAASALSAASVFRCLMGFAFPLFGVQLYSTLGVGGGNSLLAGLAIVVGIPFPIWIWYKGEEIRLRSPLSR